MKATVPSPLTTTEPRRCSTLRKVPPSGRASPGLMIRLSLPCEKRATPVLADTSALPLLSPISATKTMSPLLPICAHFPCAMVTPPTSVPGFRTVVIVPLSHM